MATELVAERTSTRHLRRDIAVGIVSGREQREVEMLLTTVRKMARRLSAVRPFWEA
jgi:hypothetical protein